MHKCQCACVHKCKRCVRANTIIFPQINQSPWSLPRQLEQRYEWLVLYVHAYVRACINVKERVCVSANTIIFPQINQSPWPLPRQLEQRNAFATFKQVHHLHIVGLLVIIIPKASKNKKIIYKISEFLRIYALTPNSPYLLKKRRSFLTRVLLRIRFLRLFSFCFSNSKPSSMNKCILAWACIGTCG